MLGYVLKPGLKFSFDPDKSKPYKELQHNVLNDEHMSKSTDFLDTSDGFKSIKSKLSLWINPA